MSVPVAPPPKKAGHTLEVGAEFDVLTGNVAHGGHVVARIGDVVAFVRGALPGESVRIRVTDVRSKFVRADAIEIHHQHAERRPALCVASGVCGGCDFQHASETLQRQMKLSVLRESLIRHGRLPQHRVDELLGEGVIDLGLTTGWRSRMRYRVMTDPGDPASTRRTLGMFRHRSDDLVDASPCVIAHGPGHRIAMNAVQNLPLDSEIIMSVGEDAPIITIPGRPSRDEECVRHRIRVDGKPMDFHVPAEAFWQVHPYLSQAIVDTLVELARPGSGERWWDLYAGVGPISAALGACVGRQGRVGAVESSSIAVQIGRRALDEMPWVEWHEQDVRKWLKRGGHSGSRSSDDPALHGVVLDPPRSGAGPEVLRSIAARRPGVIVVVACDPVALGRDTAFLAQMGYQPSSMRVWDAFPQTHHMETFATFRVDDRIS